MIQSSLPFNQIIMAIYIYTDKNPLGDSHIPSLSEFSKLISAVVTINSESINPYS